MIIVINLEIYYVKLRKIIFFLSTKLNSSIFSIKKKIYDDFLNRMRFSITRRRESFSFFSFLNKNFQIKDEKGID